MGGWGSGRTEYATTPTVEESCQIDANHLTEIIDYPGNAHATYEWDPRRYPTVELTVHVEAVEEADRATHIRLEYTVEPVHDEAFEEEHPVAIEYTKPNFGGVRPWFRCPGVIDGEECRRRARKLYLPNGARYWFCRECYGLVYRSSRSSGNDRKRAKQRYQKAFAKADAENRRPHPNNPPFRPERPKGMHHDTFEELLADVHKAEIQWTEEVRKQMNQLFESLEYVDSDRRIPDPMDRES